MAKEIEAKGPHWHLGDFIREHRLKTGLSQKEMSFALGFKSNQPLSMIERGQVALASTKIRLFCEVAKLDIHAYLHRAAEDHREYLLSMVTEMGGVAPELK